MYTHGEDIVDSYGFHFLEDVEEPFIRMTAIGRESRYSSRYHWETRGRGPAWLFQYTLKGSGMVNIAGQEYLADEGKAFFLEMPGEESYYFDEERNQAPWEFIYMMFESNGAECYCRYIEEHLGKVLELPVYHEAVRLIVALHAAAKEQKAQSAFALSSKAFEFLCLLCARQQSSVDSDSDLTARARNYIRQNSSRDIGISDTAAYLKVSQSHLSREFYRNTGMKPIDYLTRMRLEKAVDLLGSTSMKIAEIGKACGFSGSNYFSKVFRKHMNMTPVQFRDYIRSGGYSKIQI